MKKVETMLLSEFIELCERAMDVRPKCPNYDQLMIMVPKFRDFQEKKGDVRFPVQEMLKRMRMPYSLEQAAMRKMLDQQQECVEC